MFHAFGDDASPHENSSQPRKKHMDRYEGALRHHGALAKRVESNVDSLHVSCAGLEDMRWGGELVTGWEAPGSGRRRRGGVDKKQ